MNNKSFMDSELEGNMRQVRIDEINEEIAFAEKAAKYFAEHKEVSTYTESEIVAGCFFAVRWGLGDDCVVVIKLDDLHEPKNYANLVRKHQKDA